MPDKFGRHKSTRWVKAEVPSYGDEWNDDYDYEYASNSDQESVPALPEIHQELPLAPVHQQEAKKPPPAPPLPANGLVLSIDNLDRTKYDEDDDEDETSAPEIVADERDNTQRRPQPLEVSVSNPHDDSFQPPTPTFNTSQKTPETPQSDRSFQSDADLIQFEPESLNVAPVSHLRAPSATVPVLQEEDENTPAPEDPPEAPKAPQTARTPPEPLVLSIDRRLVYLDDDSSDDDWGYNSQHSSNGEPRPMDHDLGPESEADDPILHYGEDTDEGLHFQRPQSTISAKSGRNGAPSAPNRSTSGPSEGDTPEEALHYTKPQSRVSSHEHRVKTDALDLLISDLENASMVESEHADHSSYLPNMDLLHDISLPDFEDKSFSEYDKFQNDVPTTPIAPLSKNEIEEEHDSFIKELLGHRPSIRKPPTKTDRRELMSVDYSNIADAVSGYIRENTPPPELSGRTGDVLDANSDRFSFHNHLETNLDRLAVDHAPRSVASSGSLSTGQLSLEGGEDTPPEAIGDEPHRRMSTASQNTIQMGSWKPNTGNFRDQFIGDNDNELAINFNPYSDTTNYNKFTKLRTASTFSHASNRSMGSVPDTIDVALPNIHEDPDDGDEEEKAQNTFDSLQPSQTNTDSVLGDYSYSKPIFKEEKLTPNASKDTVGEPKQRYSSLLSHSTVPSDSAETITKRVDSVSSVSSDKTASTSTTKKFTAQPYPPYSWKSIMSTSQPIDRIRLLRDASSMESQYDLGLQNWLRETLQQVENSPNMHIGKIATAAYQNAAHNDIRRHTSIRSMVRDRVETSGMQATSLGKKFFSKSRKLMKSSE